MTEPEREERQTPSAHASSTLKSTVVSLNTRTSILPFSHRDDGTLGHGTERAQTWPAVPSDKNDIAANEKSNPEAHSDTPQTFIVTSTPGTPISRHFPQPDSWRDLYQNLRLSLNLRPLPTLPALVDYHDAYPKYRSRHSYNLLIELSIRHSQFGTTEWLFSAMMHDKILRNFTTRILEVRFLVRTGRWESAWSRATGLTPRDAYDKPLQNGRPPIQTEMPAEMWKELLCMGKQGVLRRTRDTRWGVDKAGNKIRLPPLEIVDDPAVPGTKTYLRRQALLSCIHPTFGSGIKSVRPQLVKYVVSWMLSGGKQTEAIALVKLYLSQLPPYLREETAAQCMDIIHTLLSKSPDFNANRKLLLQLVKAHPFLKPSPTTLRLILAPLKKFTQCGVVALGVMKDFQKRWGDQIVDSSVRMKVADLAEKQGSRDIPRRMLQEDKKARRAAHGVVTESPLTQKVEDTRGLRRPPDRELFAHPSFEMNRWRRVEKRVRQKQRRDVQECIPK